MAVKRGESWSLDETAAIIDLWADENVQMELDSNKRNINVYRRLSNQMAQITGCIRSGEECRAKIKRLKREFYMVHNTLGKKGASRIKFPHYDRIYGVLSKKTSMKSGRCSTDSPTFDDSDGMDSLHEQAVMWEATKPTYANPTSEDSLQFLTAANNSVPVTPLEEAQLRLMRKEEEKIELEKEKLVLEKEKLILEKEKLTLEIAGTRRKLGLNFQLPS